VIAAVTHDQLAALTEQALEAGAHVLVEKPAGLDVADIERLMQAASAVDQWVKVGFNRRSATVRPIDERQFRRADG
jgi:predicted dehydrogenase